MASKKHRRKILSYYKQQNSKSPEETETQTHFSEKKKIKKDKKVWHDITTARAEIFPPGSEMLEKIKTFMAGTRKFIIYLTDYAQGKFIGAIIQSGNFKSQFEVFPRCDKILFSINKNGLVEIVYGRVYSDFPTSLSGFTLKEIGKVEELKTA